MLFVLTWVPLAGLAALQGVLFGHKVSLPLLYDFSMYARYFVGLPLLIIAEVVSAASLPVAMEIPLRIFGAPVSSTTAPMIAFVLIANTPFLVRIAHSVTASACSPPRHNLGRVSNRGAAARRRAAMKQYVGLDVSERLTSVCVVDENGRKVWAGKCLSTPEALAFTIRERARRPRNRTAVRMALSRTQGTPGSRSVYRCAPRQGSPLDAG